MTLVAVFQKISHTLGIGDGLGDPIEFTWAHLDMYMRVGQEVAVLEAGLQRCTNAPKKRGW
ncbi:MAG: hypothetical protein WCE68_14845 [Anaerolineales bacterium]